MPFIEVAGLEGVGALVDDLLLPLALQAIQDGVAGLQVAGGALLIWIAFKLLKEEEEGKEGIKIAATMREAIMTILIADFVMSMDNVLAVAAASEYSR